MKFIVDECTGMAVAVFLRAEGHDVVCVGEDLPQETDQVILDRASADGRILITNDKDFGELVFRSGKPHHGIILLRLRDESPSNRVRVINVLLQEHGNRLMRNFLVVSEKEVRVRPFPE